MFRIILLLLAFGQVFGYECPFCDQDLIERQEFDQNGLARAIVNYRPLEQGHVMVIPKRHVARFEELDGDEMLAIFELLKKVDTVIQKEFGTTNYILRQKNGISAGQSVHHVHFHYIPRKEGKAPGLGFLLKIGFNSLKWPMSETEVKALAARLREAAS